MSRLGRVYPILHQSIPPAVPPLAHEGMALRNNEPKAFREAFWPSSGPRGYLSPTTATSPLVINMKDQSLILIAWCHIWWPRQGHSWCRSHAGSVILPNGHLEECRGLLCKALALKGHRAEPNMGLTPWARGLGNARLMPSKILYGVRLVLMKCWMAVW